MGARAVSHRPLSRCGCARRRSSLHAVPRCAMSPSTSASAETTTTNATHASSAPELTFTAIAKSLLAGGVAGGVSRTAVAPLERLKILQQVAGKDGGAYRGVVSGLSYMWRTEGMKGFFKGNGANCVRIVPNSAVKFLCYDHMSHAILRARQTVDETAEMDVLTRLAGGAGAGIIAMSATYPLDMVRGRLTVQKAAADGSMNGQYRGITHAFSVILQKEGMGAFYKGWTPSVIGVIPYVGLNFAIYETLKDVATTMQGLNSPKDLDVASGLACGGVAGAVGQTVAYPFDVCRRRLQVSGWVQAGATSGPVYTGMMDCFRQTVRNEGFGALFHGLSANYVKIMPSIAIAFVVYDKAKLALFSEGEAYAKISS